MSVSLPVERYSRFVSIMASRLFEICRDAGFEMLNLSRTCMAVAVIKPIARLDAINLFNRDI